MYKFKKRSNSFETEKIYRNPMKAYRTWANVIGINVRVAQQQRSEKHLETSTGICETD